MSNIYIQEPPTYGKVLVKTSAGDIDIELWSKECPKACRNFVQLCLEGYYNGTIFHRVVKGFIVQGGDPNGDGTGGESIYGESFKDEFHSRLRFIRRGLVGSANSDKDDNGSQFFFTMAPTPELTNKHTLFGKVTGDTVFNMLKLEEGVVDHNERPIYPHKIIKTEVLSNPFTDIEPREKVTKEKKDKKKNKLKGVKNFALLSFGEEADQDEFETNKFVKTLSGKGKSTHDVLDDPTLSKKAIEIIKDKEGTPSDIEDNKADDNLSSKERTERIKNKLKSHSSSKNPEKSKKKFEKEKTPPEILERKDNSDSEDDAVLMPLEQEIRNRNKKKKDEIMQEILSLKKDYKKEKEKKLALLDVQTDKDKKKKEVGKLFEEFNAEREKFSNLKSKLPKKGAPRENFTLELLNKFKNKLHNVKEKDTDDDIANSSNLTDDIIEKEINTDDWLKHTLKFDAEIPILAKDASTKSDDWYDVYDPRNPLNKRKRESDKKLPKKSRFD